MENMHTDVRVLRVNLFVLFSLSVVVNCSNIVYNGK